MNKSSADVKSKQWTFIYLRNSRWRFKALSVKNVNKTDSMLDVLIFFVKRIEKNETIIID
jgi:hypothetical protein